MSKAFVKDDAGADDDDEGVGAAPPIPPGSKNYVTPAGYRRMKEELLHLLDVDRPQVVSTVAWAASNGDRSENGDYIYGKKRLREIDRRIRFLTRRLDAAEVVDPATRMAQGQTTDQVFFGATVRYLNGAGDEVQIAIVGIDELDLAGGACADQGARRRRGAAAHAGRHRHAGNPSGQLRGARLSAAQALLRRRRRRARAGGRAAPWRPA
jgi:transcription elongation factor GreB